MSKLKEKAEDYQGSISDLMAGLTFIFIITCMVFIIKLKKAEERKSAIETESKEHQEIRNEILTNLENDLKQMNLKVHVDKGNGVLRLRDELGQEFFKQGHFELTEHGISVTKHIGSRLKIYLNCSSTPIKKLCDSKGKLKIENLFVEGHADQAPLEGATKELYKDNLGLSAQRARFAYKILETEIGLSQLALFQNLSNESILNISGYGDSRLINKHANYLDLTSAERRVIDRENRRIDLRFIMQQPELLRRGISSEE